MPSYGGMNFASGFNRLNDQVEANSTLVEPNTVTDLNCLNSPYNNNFEVDGFYVDTPGHYIPGQASSLVAEGVACGTAVKKEGSEQTCTGGGDAEHHDHREPASRGQSEPVREPGGRLLGRQGQRLCHRLRRHQKPGDPLRRRWPQNR